MKKRRKEIKRLKKGILQLALKNRGLLSRKDLKTCFHAAEFLDDLLDERKGLFQKMLRKGLKLITFILAAIAGNKSDL